VAIRFILASASPARLQTLKSAGVEATPVISGIDESLIAAATNGETVAALARAKAQAVAEKGRSEGWLDSEALVGSQPYLIVGCDSMLEFEDVVLGKPRDSATATQWWQAMRGKSGVLLTGHHVIYVDGYNETERTQVAATQVHFANLSDAEIAAYVATGEPEHVAGAFTIDGLGGAFVDSVNGDPHTVVGLSLPLLRRMLLELGIEWHALWRR
jgi:septum formation protein